jgi:hypothetical protein
MTRSAARPELTVADRSGPALKTQEVIVFTIRRLAAALCALCLIIPAAASAKVADAGHATPVVKDHVAYGDTKYDLQNQQKLNGVTGDTKGDLIAPTSGNGYVDVAGDTKGDLKAPSSGNVYVDKVGSLSAAQLAAAYGTSRPTATPVSTPASSKSPDNGTDEWRVAAVVEAALLAAFAVGAALALSGRQRRRAAGLGV